MRPNSAIYGIIRQTLVEEHSKTHLYHTVYYCVQFWLALNVKVSYVTGSP